MELRVLRYFLTLAREENISRAAEALYITQPTLSRQLAELEEELGVKLFERGKRRITLTEDGILLRRRAEEMAELEEKMEREFRSRGENLAGAVRAGCLRRRSTVSAKNIPKSRSSCIPRPPTAPRNGWTAACSIWDCSSSRATSKNTIFSASASPIAAG